MRNRTARLSSICLVISVAVAGCGGAQTECPSVAADETQPVSAAAEAETVAAPAPAPVDRHAALAESEFVDDYPTEAAKKNLMDELYFQRATQAFLWALPVANMMAMKEGHAALTKGEGYQKMGVYEERLKPNTLITTPNSDVIYGLGWLEMSKTGPMVIEAPPGMQALLDDMWHRALVGPKQKDGTPYMGDIGLPGPDKGKGGKYLILPPGAKREDFNAKKYFIYESSTNGVFVFLRSFFKSSDNLTPAVEALEKIKIYPLKGDKAEMEFYHLSNLPGNSLWPRDWTYFQLVDRMIQAEPVDGVDPYMNGVLAALGIKKGFPFAPSDAQKKLLTDAVMTGQKMAKTIAAEYDTLSSPTFGKTRFWDNQHWVAHALVKDGDMFNSLVDTSFNDRKTGHTAVDAKAHMFINHYSMSNMMISSQVGIGAKYTATYKDATGAYLNGSCTYKLDLPPNIPAKLFWSVTVYDADTAAGIQTKNTYPSIGDRDKPVQNADGSTTLYFGPEPPAGQEKNYVNTPEHTGWFTILRLYAPDEGIFNMSWRPGEVEKLSCK